MSETVTTILAQHAATRKASGLDQSELVWETTWTASGQGTSDKGRGTNDKESRRAPALAIDLQAACEVGPFLERIDYTADPPAG